MDAEQRLRINARSARTQSEMAMERGDTKAEAEWLAERDAADAGADALALLRELRHQKHSSCDCGIADEIFDQIDVLLTRAGRA